MEKTKTRIMALDVLRGLTVALMIVVNNGGGGSTSYAQLRHSAWDGLTLCDMVFPTFLFIMGISTYLSLSKTGFGWSAATVRKILKRTVIILLIGWALHWVEHLFKAEWLPIDNLRLTGVLPRIALCYFAVSMLAIAIGRRARPVGIMWTMAALLLAAYTALLLWGNGLVNETSNILVRIDRSILGEAHLYAKQPVDPEGITSTLSAIAHTMIGFCFGSMLKDKSLTLDSRLAKLMAVGVAVLLCGMAVANIVPVNKRIWSPSYVLVSCALAALVLGMLCYIIDVRRLTGWWTTFAQVYGVNPLFLYVLSEVGSVAMGATGAKKAVYGWILAAVPDAYVASAVYAVGFALCFFALGWVLYRKGIRIVI